MKYRLFEHGYEAFLDNRVPEEYKDIVINELPQEIIDAGIAAAKSKPNFEERISQLENEVALLKDK